MSSFDLSTEEMTDALPLLYQSGYLTIKKYEPMFREYTLGIPNKEVRDGLLNSLIPHYVNPRRSDNDAFLLGFCKAVYRNDIEAALEYMRTYLATIPYDLENHSEKHYQTIFYLMFSFLNIYIKTEVKSAIGRADAVMHMLCKAFMMTSVSFLRSQKYSAPLYPLITNGLFNCSITFYIYFMFYVTCFME